MIGQGGQQPGKPGSQGISLSDFAGHPVGAWCLFASLSPFALYFVVILLIFVVNSAINLLFETRSTICMDRPDGDLTGFSRKWKCQYE